MKTGESYNRIKDEISLGDVLFLAERNREENMEFHVHMNQGDVFLKFCFLDQDEKEFVLISQQIMEEKGWDRETLYAHGILNMRKRFPCRCVSLESYVQKHPERMWSAPAMEQIYMLVCENENFPYVSTGLYYSAKEIRELAETLNSDLYVFQCDAGSTFLCPAGSFTREEAAQILESFAKESKTSFKGQVLVYSDGHLSSLHPYEKVEYRKQSKTI